MRKHPPPSALCVCACACLHARACVCVRVLACARVLAWAWACACACVFGRGEGVSPWVGSGECAWAGRGGVFTHGAHAPFRRMECRAAAQSPHRAEAAVTCSAHRASATHTVQAQRTPCIVHRESTTAYYRSGRASRSHRRALGGVMRDCVTSSRTALAAHGAKMCRLASRLLRIGHTVISLGYEGGWQPPKIR